MPPSVETTKATWPTFAVHQQRQIELGFDVRAVFDIQTVDLFAFRAGLVGHQRIAQHFLGVLGHVFLGEGEAHAALGVGIQFLELALAAAAGMDLGFHNPERPGQLVSGFGSFFDGKDGDALRRPERRKTSTGLWPGIRECSWSNISRTELRGVRARNTRT
jgi:hypothetical protein